MVSMRNYLLLMGLAVVVGSCLGIALEYVAFVTLWNTILGY